MGCGTSKSKLQESGAPFHNRDIPPPIDLLLETRSSSIPREGFTQDENNLLNNFKISRADLIRSNSTQIHDQYRILSPPIGKGAFGEVRKAIHKITEVTYAIKIINCKDYTPEEEETLFNEVNILRTLDHPCVMRIYEFFKEEHFFYIVSEYCAGGDLMDRIKQGSFEEKETARIIQ